MWYCMKSFKNKSNNVNVVKYFFSADIPSLSLCCLDAIPHQKKVATNGDNEAVGSDMYMKIMQRGGKVCENGKWDRNKFVSQT